VSRPLTVVIPARSRAGALRPLLDELDRQARSGPVLAVVVSDDASPEPLEQLLEVDTFPGLAVTVVRSPVNHGPGAARNRGLAAVETPWVAFLDADEVPAEGWLERAEALAADASSAPVVEGAIDDGGVTASAFTHAGTLAGGSHLAGNLLVRAELLRTAGGFDERFYDARLRLHFREDSELLFRLEAAGHAIRRDEALLVRHPPHAATLVAPLRDARRYHFDPLLARLHPERFRAFNDRRHIGPISLRRARHLAALAHVAGGGLALASGGRGRTGVFAAALAAAGWGATAIALSWGRRVPPREVLPLAVVSLGVPWVYVGYYYAGVVRFRHLPRL
jgi:glycosyltransferase involved in cell wall biosynthesis